MAFNSSAFLQARQAGTNALAGGISAAGDSITKAIENHTAESKRLKAYKAMAIDGLGLDAEEVEGMNADQIEGKLKSVAVRSAMAQQQREEEDQQFQQAQRTAGQQFQQRLSLPPGAAGPPAPMTPDRILGAAAETGLQLDPRIIAQFAQQGSEEGAMPEGMTVDGVPLLVSRRTGKFEVRPDFLAKLNAENKTKADPSLILSRRTKALADWEKLVSPVEENLRRAEANLKNPKLKAYHPQYEADIKTLTTKLRQLTAQRPRFDGEDDAPAAAAEATAQPAQGGYKIGTRYSGLTYIGGDPKQESSWQK